MKCVIDVKKSALEKLEKMPLHIVTKLEHWVDAVEKYGISAVRKVPGYHDESLKGDRKGQRSIRLNRAYRAIYEEKVTGEINLILIVEVSKHEY